jgi:hypothetical protein
MTVHIVTPTLVRVDGWFRERYVELSRGIWVDAKSGLAVCPTTAAAIARRLEKGSL